MDSPHTYMPSRKESIYQDQTKKKDQDTKGSSRNHRKQKQGRTNDFSTIGANLIFRKEEKDIFQIKYFNWRKKNHYSTKCLKKKDAKN